MCLSLKLACLCIADPLSPTFKALPLAPEVDAAPVIVVPAVPVAPAAVPAAPAAVDDDADTDADAEATVPAAA